MINNFGEEDKSFITNRDLKKMIISHYRGLQRLIVFIYFNDTYPNNHTIKHNPLHPNMVEVMDNGEFVMYPKEYVLDTIILDTWKIFYDFYEEMEKNNELFIFKNSLVCSETFDRIQNFIDSYRRLCEGEQSIIKDIREDILNLIKYQYKVSNKLNKKKPKKKRNSASDI